MRSPQQPLYAIFGVAFLLAGCDPGAGTSSQAAAASQPAAAGNKCQEPMRVTVDNDPHFELEQRFRISGPNQDGDYRLRPLGSGHTATPKDHHILKSGSAADKFDGEIEMQGQGHGQPNLHFYVIDAALDSNGCPTKLTLKTEQHAGDPVIGVHGGDAVMD